MPASKTFGSFKYFNLFISFTLDVLIYCSYVHNTGIMDDAICLLYAGEEVV